ncbi:hypothetical protein WICPIJ_007568 [Wickerhamomyces pijperi]|uniref:Nucleoporin n=1 Tax=Wickerhamomyces pijperi TaxID=599730 RepID=A0A9P8Q279_WICPI|nr:hypothetical protein WICPIJ_007568 [Wickerhamomyces pijperi]
MSTSHWTVGPFAELYQSIATTGSLDQSLFNELQKDLNALTVVPPKNASSRTTLESGKIKIQSLEYEVNQDFKIAAVELSDELNIDELISAEILLAAQQSQPDESVTALKDIAKAYYYLRKQHILQIVSFIYNASTDSRSVHTLWKKEQTDKSILKSFQGIHEELASIHQLVQKARILEIGQTQDFKMKVAFRRNALQSQHETLSEILHGASSLGLLTVAQFKEILGFLASSYDVDDLFAIHLLPCLLKFISNFQNLPDEDIKQLHSDLLKDLKSDNAYQSPMKVLVILIFLTYFIAWCKSSSTRLSEFDFEIAVESPMVLAVQLGALEQLLVVNASLAATCTTNLMEPLYDLRSLLEQHLPRLEAKRVLDINEEETRRLKLTNPTSATSQVYIHTKQTTISENLTSFITDTLHDFTQAFISDAAFLLIKLKDSEEDSLLSSTNTKEDKEASSSLESAAKRADLERFYLSVYYLYSAREDLIWEFWTDRESNAYGFITWASNANESLLMRSAFLVMMSALTKADEGRNATYVYGFIAGLDKLSWTSMHEDMTKIIEQIQALEAKDAENLDIPESTVLQMACMLNIVYAVALNGNEELKKTFDSTLLDTLFQFLKLDTTLVGPTLRVLSSLVCPSRKNTMWENIEIWLFGYQFGTFKEAFQSRLSTFPDVVGFIELLETLLHLDTHRIGKYALPYPQDLGHQLRKAGIAPYLEFLLSDVLYHSRDLYFEEQLALQEPILRIVKNCLGQFDPKLILMSFPASVNLNTIVSTRDFTTFVQASPAPLVLSLLFQDRVARCLLEIVGTGVENINDKQATEKQVRAVDLALQVLQQVLDLEVTYFDELLPILRKDNRYIQPSFGMNSFYDILLSHLPVVAHIALYIGSRHLAIASKSVKLLRQFAKSSQLGGSKSKLLTILTSVNESLRIKHAFIDQLTSLDFSGEDSLALKLDIFHLINDNLSFSNQKATVAHFLLGFNVKNGISLGSSNKPTYIASSKSLLGSIIFILESSLLSLQSYDIDYPPSRFASLSLEILLKLCRNNLTSELTMNHLQGYGLVDKLLTSPRLDQRTLWCGSKFDPSINVPTKFNAGAGIGAFLALLNQRNFISQYLSLELHRTSQTGSISKTQAYINSLINDGSYGKLAGPAKVLLLLDMLEFEFEEELPTFEQSQLQFFQNVDLNVDLNSIKLSNVASSGLFNLEELDSVLDLQLRQLSVQGVYHTDEEAKESLKAATEFKNEVAGSTTNSMLIKIPTEIKSNEDQAKLERLMIKSKLSNHLALLKFKTYQLSALHSWCQLISVIVTDGKLTLLQRSEFILEVFQTILPRINFEKNILHSEELVSLCVSLYDLYIQGEQQGATSNIDGFERLYPLFKTCMDGIISQVSSLSLRSDLYVLAHKYLTWISGNKDVSQEILQSIKISNERLITVITNDAISSKGPTRITALLLLETLYKLSESKKSNLVLSVLVKNNMLLLLVKSIKRTDESLMHHSTLQSLLYELTAFKATVSLLIRIGETRGGSLALLQSEVFPTIKSCSFLNIDVDLGLDLQFEEHGKVNLNLWDSNGLNVSLLELLTPVFQLIAAILLSTSSENTVVINQVRRLLVFFDKMITGVLKKDVLMEKNGENAASVAGLNELVNLFILLSTLTRHNQEEEK